VQIVNVVFISSYPVTPNQSSPAIGGLFLMSKHIGYYLSHKSLIDLDPIDALAPEAKIDLARNLLNLAALRSGQKIEGIALSGQVARFTKAELHQIEAMTGYEKIRLAGATLITACDEMSIEREETIAFGEDVEASLDEFLIA
jgi:hypothetical protein